MPEYDWICLNKQNSEYASVPKYTKILNMAGVSISESYTAFWICQNMPWQSSWYILGSKFAKILNKTEFWVCLVQYIARGHCTS